MIADLARAEKDGFEIGGGAVNGGREKFLHADGGASSMNISRQRQKLLGLDHFDGFFTDGCCRLFQMQFFRGGDHENVIFSRFSDGDQGFEYVRGVLSERRGEIDGGYCARRQIAVAFIRNFGLIQNSHDVGFFFFCHRVVLSDERAEFFNAVESGIVGVVEILRVVDRGAAEINDIFALDFKIDVLKTDLCAVLVSVVVEIADHAPATEIVRADEGKEISVACMFGIVYARGDGIIFFRYLIVFDHKFGIVAGKGHAALIGERCIMILCVDGVNESSFIFTEAHDIDELSIGIDCERTFDRHGAEGKLRERIVEAVEGSRLGKAPVFGDQEIVVLVAGHHHRGMTVFFVCPRSPFQRFINSAVITKDVLWILMNARVSFFAVGATQERDGRGKGLAAVRRFADQKVAVFRRAGEHIELTLVNEHFSPEAGHKLADVVPGLSIVVGAEDQGQVLRMIACEKVHGSKQKAVGMANERGRAEKSARKRIRFVLGMEIIDDRSDRRAATRKTDAAFPISGTDVKFVFLSVGKSRNIALGLIGRCPMNEIAISALAVTDIVAGFTDRQPFKMNFFRLRYDTANINIAHLCQKGSVRSVAPGGIAFHSDSFLCALAHGFSVRFYFNKKLVENQPSSETFAYFVDSSYGFLV